jgi:superoxide dismutase, Fe-Mn family
VSDASSTETTAGYTLPPLPYAYDALEPYVDQRTMRLHHDHHHRSHIEVLNHAIAPYPQWRGLIIEDLVRRLPEVPEQIRQTVRDHGGGHANHQFFWKVIGPPRGTAPTGALAEALDRDFGGPAAFQRAFNDAALRHFGSGWAFLVVNPAGPNLEILVLPNQDSVLSHGRPGLLACDLWEHAHYLRYADSRADYLNAWWHVVAWDVVSRRFENFLAGKQQL